MAVNIAQALQTLLAPAVTAGAPPLTPVQPTMVKPRVVTIQPRSAVPNTAQPVSQPAVGADASPIVQPSAAAARPALASAVASAADRNKVHILPSGVRNFASDVSAGMTGVPGGVSPLSAFAYGLSGALGNEDTRSQREAAAELAAQDREDKRNQQELENQYAANRDRRDNERLDLERKKTDKELGTGTDGLSDTAIYKIEERVADYATSLGLKSTEGMDPEEREQKLAETRKYRKWLTDYTKKHGKVPPYGEEPPPSESGKDEDRVPVPEGDEEGSASGQDKKGDLGPVSITPRGVLKGDGSQAKPVSGISTMDDLKKVPLGGYYINPADGKTYRRTK
jgi:hypothetical protein